MVRLEARFQAAQDRDRLFDRRLGHVDLLEAPRQRVIFLEHAAVLVVGGRADAFQRPGGERRLEEVRSVQGPARGGAGTDQRVDLVDEKDRIRVVHQLLQHRLQALLEIAAVLGPREQRAHVEHVNLAARENFGHLTLDDAAREPLGDRGLAHARLAHEERVVLAPPAQRLDDALDLALAADQRIDLADQRLGVEVERIGFEGAAGLLLVARGFLLGLAAAFGFLRCRRLGDAVRDVVHDVEARHALLVEEIYGVRVLLAENGDEHVRAGDFLLARGLHVQDRALDDALEAQRGLRVDFRGSRDRWRMRGDEVPQGLSQFLDVGGAGAQHFRRGGVVQQREQQVLDGDELMPLLASLHESHVQADFEFLGDHRLSAILFMR